MNHLDQEQQRLKAEMDARKARHPYPGGWRADTKPTAIENAVTRITKRVGRGDNFGAARARAACLGAAYLFPDALEVTWHRCHT